MYNLGDIVSTRKPHPCGNNIWTVVRTGADIKIKCNKCGHVVMLPLEKFNKSVKKVINEGKNEKDSKA
jgi:hypothetical protein